MYTVSSLIAANPSKIYEIREKDAINVNALVALLEKNFHSPEPTPGDLIICHGYSSYYNKEVVYTQGIIDKVQSNGMLHICVEPMVPHVLASGHLSTSGGYWFTCHKDEIKRSQKETSGQRTFWCWDNYGREMIRHKSDSLYLNSLLVARDVGVVEGCPIYAGIVVGPRAQGGLYFQAKVKIWAVTSSKVY